MPRFLPVIPLGVLLCAASAFAPDEPAIGGLRAGMTLQQVFKAKERHCKVIEDAATGLTTLLYDDVAVLVKGYRELKRDVVHVEPATEEMKQKAKDAPWADEGEQKLFALSYRPEPAEAPDTRTLESCEKVIREHADDRPLCAWAQRGIGRVLEKNGRLEEAIKAYQKAADDYGDERLLFVNARMRVRDSALLHIAAVHEKSGRRNEALAICRGLMNDAWDANIRNGSRIRFLSLSQAHLKVEATVALAKTAFAPGEDIPVTVVFRNDADEDVVLEAFVSVRRAKGRSYGFTRNAGDGEWVLPARSTVERKVTLAERDTKGLEPNAWQVECTSGRVPLTSNAVDISIVKP